MCSSVRPDQLRGKHMLFHASKALATATLEAGLPPFVRNDQFLTGSSHIVSINPDGWPRVITTVVDQFVDF
jgi:hypothetical protein